MMWKDHPCAPDQRRGTVRHVDSHLPRKPGCSGASWRQIRGNEPKPATNSCGRPGGNAKQEKIMIIRNINSKWGGSMQFYSIEDMEAAIASMGRQDALVEQGGLQEGRDFEVVNYEDGDGERMGEDG
jgi:hypothetical protein